MPDEPTKRDKTARHIAFVMGLALMGAPATAAGGCPRSAASLYDDARKAFEDKRFDDSIVLLRKAYACDRDPVYLANIARSQEEANRPRDALAAWRAYLAVVTDAQERTRVEGRVSALTKMVEDLDRLQREKEVAERARAAAESAALARPAPATAPSKEGARVPLAAWLVGAAGGLAMGGGVVMWALAGSKHSSANQELQEELHANESPQAAILANHDAQSVAQAGNILFAAGGVVAAVGLGWAGISLLGSGSDHHEGVTVGVSGSTIRLDGRF